MGNQGSSLSSVPSPQPSKGFPGSALVEGMLCGSDTTTNTTRSKSLLQQADELCVSSPEKTADEDLTDMLPEGTKNESSQLFARAIVKEVTDNPNTMTPQKLKEREVLLLKSQQRTAKKNTTPVSVWHSWQHYVGANDDDEHTERNPNEPRVTVEPPSVLQETRAAALATTNTTAAAAATSSSSRHRITIGVCLSRRHAGIGHSDTVTRQSAFDFNELQDRDYKYVSSTDVRGWRAGGGERGGVVINNNTTNFNNSLRDTNDERDTTHVQPEPQEKVAAPDQTYLPILHIDADSQDAVDAVIEALARGDVFIPHMAVLPEALAVTGISPPDLVLRFGCERNEDTPPDEWPNWCLEFMHNQLYEYFEGAQWMTRPFTITLAKKVKWKTVKHMNRYFSHAERVLDAWREKGPQYLDPQLTHIDGGATPEEVARPHGVYLFQNNVPTNYFAPNLDPPYTTKMTRSLLLHVLNKSWNKHRREWSSQPVPRLVTPSLVMNHLCGCPPTEQGFLPHNLSDLRTVPSTAVEAAITMDDDYYQQSPEISPEKRTERKAPTPEQPRLASEGSLVAASIATTVAHANLSPTRGDATIKSSDYKKKKRSKQEREAELTREIAKVALLHNAPAQVPASVEQAIRDPKKVELAQAVADYEEKKTEPSSSPRALMDVVSSDSQSIQKTDSYVSLEYSMDSSMLGGGDSSITGNYFAADGSSVGTAASRHQQQQQPRSLLNGVPKKQLIPPNHNLTITTTDDDGSLLDSVVSAGTSVTDAPVPTDQELFSIGWAKALDPKSGAYYYFTLDRTKIVWDNPLLEKSVISGSSSK